MALLLTQFTAVCEMCMVCCKLNFIEVGALSYFSPELFDYNELIGRDTTSTLQHAFSVGQERLGIPTLLDPDGCYLELFFTASLSCKLKFAKYFKASSAVDLFWLGILISRYHRLHSSAALL